MSAMYFGALEHPRRVHGGHVGCADHGSRVLRLSLCSTRAACLIVMKDIQCFKRQ